MSMQRDQLMIWTILVLVAGHKTNWIKNNQSHSWLTCPWTVVNMSCLFSGEACSVQVLVWLECNSWGHVRSNSLCRWIEKEAWIRRWPRINNNNYYTKTNCWMEMNVAQDWDFPIKIIVNLELAYNKKD